MNIIKAVFWYLILNISMRLLVGVAFSIIKNVSIKLDMYINHLISSKYKNSDELKDSLVIKCKYILGKIKNKQCRTYDISSLINISIFNLLLICIVYCYFGGLDKVLSFTDFIKNIRYNKFINYIMLLLLVPVSKVIWNYARIRVILRDKYTELNNKLYELIRIINANLEELNIYRIENEIEYIANEMTDNIGYKFDDGKFKVQNKKKYRYSLKEDRFEFRCITDELVEIMKFIDEEYLDDISESICNIFNLRYQMILFSVEVNENNILNYKSNEKFKDINKYFIKNSNQIYKRNFTNIRVIREQELIFLDSYIEKGENWLHNYRKDLIDYMVGILILAYEVKKYLIYVNNTLYSKTFMGVLKFIIIATTKEYFAVIKKIIY